jgi:hypothetical protein
MDLFLPDKINGENGALIADFSIGTFIGANGSGKTRLGIWLEDRHYPASHRISAQKALEMPAKVSPVSEETARRVFLLGGDICAGDPRWVKRHHRWGGNPDSHLLNDFGQLMILLHTEEYDVSIKFRRDSQTNPGLPPPKTKLDILKEIWERVLPHRRLTIGTGTVDTIIPETGIMYPATAMSDGERVIFYYIGEVLCAPENSLFIVDEPENHVHKAIQATLWDEIENSRPDCSFAYLTHDIDFAVSRTGGNKIWVKSFMNDRWDYEILNDEMPIAENIYLEILGSRKDILFIEGVSLDYHLYKEVFRERTVEPLSGCAQVISATRSFNQLSSFHRLNAVGLVDRDRRTEAEIQTLRETGMLIPEVAEVENFFMLESVVRAVAANLHQDPDAVFQTVKANVVNFFTQVLNAQVIEHTQHQLSIIAKKAFYRDLRDERALQQARMALNLELDVPSIHSAFRTELRAMIDNMDYPGILRVFNQKGITARSNVANLCGLAPRNYHHYILSELKRDTLAGQQIRAAILANIR